MRRTRAGTPARCSSTSSRSVSCPAVPSLTQLRPLTGRTIQVKHIPTWMPGAGFKRTALQARTYLDAWRVGGVKMVREAMVRAPRLEGAAALWGAHFAPSQVSGDVAPCITVSLLEAHQCNPNEDELKDIQDISVNIYGGES